MKTSEVIARQSKNTFSMENILVGLGFFFYIFVVVKNAWISDDAYITHRVVDNFVNGYGLRWNVDERVQVFTHPLWFFLLSIFYFFIDNIFYLNILLSILISIVVVLLLIFKISKSSFQSLIGILILTLSKAYIDFSTSGLENSLSHLVFAIFFIVYFQNNISSKKLFRLSFVAALGGLTRLDLLLLFFPAIIDTLIKLRSRKEILTVVKGFGLLICWELFSLFYYGSFFPNTYYAKLDTGISWLQYLIQGFFYYLDSLSMDPLTLLFIFTIIFLTISQKNRSEYPIIIGIFLYFAYVLKIGGDFMSGRFFTVPLLISILLFSRFDILKQKIIGGKWILFFLITAIGLFSQYPTLLTTDQYGRERENIIDQDTGIADEKASYFWSSSLLTAGRNIPMPRHTWAQEGEGVKREVETKTTKLVVFRSVIGYYGFFAGPKVHVIDTIGLADPFLARLPVYEMKYWRIGHFDRFPPPGYENAVNNNNPFLVEDSNLAQYYAAIHYIVSGPLIDGKRLIEILKLNTGQYEYLVDAYVNSKKKS